MQHPILKISLLEKSLIRWQKLKICKLHRLREHFRKLKAFFQNVATQSSYCLFLYFSNNILQQKNCRLQQDSNLDCQSWRKPRWPLDPQRHCPIKRNLLLVILGSLVLQNVTERLEAGEDDLRDATAALHVLHQDLGGDLQMIGVVGPILGRNGRVAWEDSVAHVVKVHLLHWQHWKYRKWMNEVATRKGSKHFLWPHFAVSEQWWKMLNKNYYYHRIGHFK